MKFTVNRTELLTALLTCGKAVSSNGIIPALSNYLFSIKGEHLSISGNNQELLIKKTVICESDDDLLIQLPSVRLRQWVGDCAEQRLTFTIVGFKITIKSATGSCEMVGEAGEDFPLIENKTGDTLNLKSSDLLSLFDRCLFACSEDASLPLGGLSVEFNSDELTITGADKNVFSSYSKNITSSVNRSVIVPAKSVAIIKTIPVDEPVSVNIGKNSLGIYSADTSIICILLDEKYPDWRPLINKDNDKFCEVNRVELLLAIKRTAIFAFEYIRLAFSEKGGICLLSENQLLQESASEVVDCDYKGDQIEIGFSGKYLKAVLSELSTDNVFLQLSAPNRPMYIRDTFTESQEPINFMLVMPITW